MAQDKSEKSVPRRILDLTYYCFNEQGYRKVPMDLIARRLRISKKTIYKHYHSKEEILEIALNDLFGDIEKRIKVVVRNDDHNQVLPEYLAVIKYYRQQLSSNLREEIRNLLPHMEGRILSFERNALHKNLNSWLKSMRKSSQIEYPSPTRELTDSLLLTMRGLVGAPDDKARFILQTFLKGMSIRKKKKK